MQNKEQQKISEEEENPRGLHKVLKNYIPESERLQKNEAKLWKYGYNGYYDVIVISKDGTVGEVYEIEGLRIALPDFKTGDCELIKSNENKEEQRWEREPLPKKLSVIKDTRIWNKRPLAFKEQFIGYIDSQFDRRENGVFFMNNGEPTYITGSQYMYLQWSPIDIGYPDYRYANRILFLFWEACQADQRSYGSVYVKIRRSGFSSMASGEMANKGTSIKNSKVGLLSKTGGDAKSMFVEKVVPIVNKYPFFFKPIQDGMDKPKTEMVFRVPAERLTYKKLTGEVDESEDEEELQGLDTIINWLNTGSNAYDSQKLKLLIHDESSKWLKPNDIRKNLRVTKTCCRLGKKIVGTIHMGSTVNKMSDGGEEFKEIYRESHPSTRGKNGQTKSGLNKIFIPMEYNMEGFIDQYGDPVLRTPANPENVLDLEGDPIEEGAIDYWENEEDNLKSNPDSLNEFYRQFPRTEEHAFRDTSDSCLFNIGKLYEQVDWNEGSMVNKTLMRGNFQWENGVKDSKVIFMPSENGRFLLKWIPPLELQNNKYQKRGIWYPGNKTLGAFGCDPYDISGTTDGRGSKGGLHGLLGLNIGDVPSMMFFCEYIARPKTSEMFFEDILMCIVFYGMPIFAENNKSRLLYHIKNRGYRGFSMNRIDKPTSKLSFTELEIGGTPNNSVDFISSHAAAIETYIDEYVGVRASGDIGSMPFNRTIKDWMRFDVTNRTKFDASISSGLAIMAVRRHLYRGKSKKSEINLNFATHNNTGTQSSINERNKH